MEDDTTPSDQPTGGKRTPGRRAKPPLTIDLAASEVAAGSAKPSQAPGPAAEPPVQPAPQAAAEPLPEPPFAAPPPMKVATPRPGGFGVVVAGILGGLVALVIGFAVAAMGLLPTPGRQAADAAAAKAEAASGAVAALEKRIASLETAAPAADLKGLTGEIQAIEVAARQMQAQLDAIAAMPAGDGAGASAALAGLAARIDQLEAAEAAAGEIAARVAAVEASLKTLSETVATLAARPYGANESERAARAVAIGTLRQAAERGGAFAGDLAMLAALGSDAADVAALRPLAEKGAPGRAELAAGFGAVADAILVASTPADPDAGLLGRIAGFARGLVTVRPTVPIAGDTPEAVVSRMQAAVDKGDLAAVLSERAGLPDAGKAASAAWAEAAEARLAIDRLVGKLTQSVAPAAPAGGG